MYTGSSEHVLSVAQFTGSGDLLLSFQLSWFG